MNLIDLKTIGKDMSLSVVYPSEIYQTGNASLPCREQIFS